MIKAGKAQAEAWAFRIDLRKIGIALGWILFATSIAIFLVLYVLAFSRADMHDHAAVPITTGVAAGMAVSAVIVWGFTVCLRAVASTIDAYQEGVQDAVARLAEALPAGELHQMDARRGRRRLHSMN